jgi:RNA polymerase sigma-70 factor (ECF subfamily)
MTTDTASIEHTRALVEAEIPRLRRHARFLVRDADRADDLVQECLMRAVGNLHRWQPGTNMRAWLFVILHRVHINEGLRARRSPLAEEAPADHPGLAVLARQEDHMALLDVQAAFDRLSLEHRQVLVLIAIEGLAYEETAAILGVPVGTVRSRLNRARRALKDRLAGAAPGA